ncbi:MAG: carbohydrate binding domain-containing protein, partial [Chloroflexi bacterium]|nr:carbohydrate binding domain-containing protein [Chloroflexota bacterium]
GNLWGWWQLADKGLPYLSRIDLWLGADPTRAEVIELRRLNPNVLVLTSINAVENDGLPDDYYLKDVNGHTIEVWPGSYRLNLTKNYVAEYQAHYAYQTMLDGGLMYDGVFFDNVMTTQSWLTHDIYGHPVQIDSDENGVADDPDVFDAAWKAGVFHELRTFRQLMPNALVSSHSTDIAEPGIAEIFNGISFGFLTADVLEGEMSFPELWDRYQAWLTRAQSPPITMFEASPPDQIAYGYDYSPLDKIPTSTLEFARTLYPYMRFGLALTLMNDGYFAYEYGDTWHGNDWWYDELDFDLGYPIGPARRADLGFDIGPSLIVNGSFESAIAPPWNFWADSGNGYTASITRDTSTAAHGSASARINITSTAGTDWRVNFYQDDRSLVKGTAYDLAFWARSNVTRTITLGAQKNAPDWDDYGLWKQVTINPTWQLYTVTFESTATASDARIQFLVGAITGTVWLDNVRLTLHPPDVYQREFTNGLVLLNGTHSQQTIALDPGYQRLIGDQAPRFETLIDDTSSGFSTPIGAWLTPTFDSGEWTAFGPFYHNWGRGVHKSQGSAQVEARWTLPISTTDVYTITVWWPAAPEASTWNPNAIYEVVANGQVVSSITLNQTTGGDEWHTIGIVSLSPSSNAYVRLRCQGAPCIADALYVRSRARYNDGSLAMTVTLQPLDGIVLQRVGSHWLYLPIIRK